MFCQCCYIFTEHCKIIIGSHALQCSDGHGRKRLPLETHIFKLSVCWSRLRPNTKLRMNSNRCMCTCTPRIRAFISVTAQLSNDQYHNSWNTLLFEITLVMASTRTVHLVGPKRQIQHCSCPSEDFLICFNFASRFCEYLVSLVIS